MAHQPMSRWQRALGRISMNLVNGIRYLFGSRMAVAYRPPNAEPKRADELQRGDYKHVSLRSATGDRLPPRERRGRD